MTDWIPAPPPVEVSRPPSPPQPRSLPSRPAALPPLPGPELLAAGRSPWKPWDMPPDVSALGALVGAGGFDFPDWAGRFYPPVARAGGNVKVASREWFPFYQLYFSFLEIGHTFYHEPRLQHFVELEKRSKSSMRYSVKVHGDISHSRAWDPEQGKSLMRKHAAAVSPLAETGRFHSFLIQLDDGLERSRKILDYLLATSSAALSEGLDVHIEFRNRTWHQESVLQALQDAGVGICNTEIPALPHAFPLKAYVTSGKGYVRYSGLNRAAWEAVSDGNPGLSPAERLRAGHARYDYLYSRAELEERVRGQKQLLQKAAATAVVFKNHAGAKAALNAIQDIHLLLGGSAP